MKYTLQLKHSFENIKKLRGDISNIFESIHSKINILKKLVIITKNNINLSFI